MVKIGSLLKLLVLITFWNITSVAYMRVGRWEGVGRLQLSVDIGSQVVIKHIICNIKI